MSLKILHTPFPQIEKPKERFWFSIIVATFIYIFLLVFQPFGIDRITYNLPVFLLGYLFITLFVLLVNYFVVFSLFPKFFNPDTWTIGKMLLMTSMEIVVIAVLNWLYTGYFAQYILVDISLSKFFLYTFSIGIVTLIIVVLASEHYLNHRSCKLAEHLSSQIDAKPKIVPNKLLFISENQNESFEILSNQLLCIKAEGNYCNIYYVDNKQVVNNLIRTSLKKLEKNFEIFSEVKRCHKSYMVNLENIEKVSGNARNYTFHMTHLPFTIPVSRSFPQQIIEAYGKY